jgi:hypothetical protein
MKISSSSFPPCLSTGAAFPHKIPNMKYAKYMPNKMPNMGPVRVKSQIESQNGNTLLHFCLSVINNLIFKKKNMDDHTLNMDQVRFKHSR